MAGTRAAQRYAKAMLSLASDNDNVKNIDAEVRLIDNTLKGSKDLRLLLKNPVVKDEMKSSCLKAIFKDAGKTITNLFDVLIHNKRIGLLHQVTQAFISQVDKMNHVTTAKVTTAVPLTSEIEEKILAKVKELTGNKATLTEAVDEELIGGFLLRIGDLQYDASISGKLNSLNYKFKHNAYA